MQRMPAASVVGPHKSVRWKSVEHINRPRLRTLAGVSKRLRVRGEPHVVDEQRDVSEVWW